MKYRGQVEFLPKVCPSCQTKRDISAILATDWGDDRELSVILPCAKPDCEESTEGDGFHVFYESKGKRLIRKYMRLAAPDGWTWSHGVTDYVPSEAIK